MPEMQKSRNEAGSEKLSAFPYIGDFNHTLTSGMPEEKMEGKMNRLFAVFPSELVYNSSMGRTTGKGKEQKPDGRDTAGHGRKA